MQLPAFPRFLLALLLCCAALLLGACSDNHKAAFNSIDVTGADYARDFTLTDSDGHPRSLKEFQGRVVVLFFGYTQCPDVCPTSMSEMVEVRRSLGDDGAKVQVLFVTIDPARDTPAVLKAYMANFDPTFIGLHADDDAGFNAVLKEFKVYAKKVEGKTPGTYTMDHSAGMYVYDPQGRLRLYTRYGSDAAALAADIRLLLQGA